MSELFQSCLGSEFDNLAPLVRKAHTGSIRLEGEVAVERGNLVAQVICKLFGMPPETPSCRLVVRGHHSATTMTWNRHFDDFPMDSYFYKDGNYLVERMGPIHMSMVLDAVDGALTYTLIKTRIFGIPIPKLISPKVVAIEKQVGNQYRFNVVVSLPIIGMLVSYFGDMQVETLAE